MDGLEKDFLAAVEQNRTAEMEKDVPEKRKLILEGLFKQNAEGNAKSTDWPGYFSSTRWSWYAHNDQKDKSPKTCKRDYISEWESQKVEFGMKEQVLKELEIAREEFKVVQEGGDIPVGRKQTLEGLLKQHDEGDVKDDDWPGYWSGDSVKRAEWRAHQRNSGKAPEECGKEFLQEWEIHKNEQVLKEVQAASEEFKVVQEQDDMPVGRRHSLQGLLKQHEEGDANDDDWPGYLWGDSEKRGVWRAHKGYSGKKSEDAGKEFLQEWESHKIQAVRRASEVAQEVEESEVAQVASQVGDHISTDRNPESVVKSATEHQIEGKEAGVSGKGPDECGENRQERANTTEAQSSSDQNVAGRQSVRKISAEEHKIEGKQTGSSAKKPEECGKEFPQELEIPNQK